MKENNFGNIISKLRKEKGIAQKDLANELCISDKAVSRWETGKSYPDLEMIFQMSKYFGIPFNDLLKLRMEDKNQDDDVVQEIIREFTELNKKSKKKLKITLVVSLVIIVFLTAVIIFTGSYNRFRVYRVSVENDQFLISYGSYIETRIKDSLQINSLNIKGVNITDEDKIAIDLYYIENGKEQIIQSYSSLDNIYFTNNQSYNDKTDLSKYMEDLYLRVKITDVKGQVSEYNTKLDFTLDFSNNKIFYKDEDKEVLNIKIDINLTSEEIKNILLKNGFEEDNDRYLIKKTKTEEITYFNSLNLIIYAFEENNLKYKYEYNLNTNKLKINITNDKKDIIEDYSYDLEARKVEKCQVGECKNYQDAVTRIYKKVLYLLSE